MLKVKERLLSFFGRRKQTIWKPITEEAKPLEKELTEEEIEMLEKARLDHFYGCDEDGKPGPEFCMLNMRSMGTIEANTNLKKVTLINIDDLKEKVSIMGLMKAFRESGKTEWEFFWAYHIVAGLRKAWKNGEKTVDLTNIFTHDVIASIPKGYKGKSVLIDDECYWSFSHENIKKLMLKVFRVVSEKDGELILAFKVK